ncbi:HAMP domain-containing sensor histidine kinase [Thalassospiraceae bacterium LMO-JJ14]|nr:HAMP domain-containing sensor histidine kinase [Thalassospiraceae bacterium LMO-JJ14]
MAQHRIKRRLRVIFSLLAFVFLTLSVASGVGALSALRQLSDTNYDNSGIAAVQLRLHYSLLLSELRGLELESPDAAVDEALLQFDILYDRLKSLPKRPPYNVTLLPEDLRGLDRIFEAIDAETPLFDAAASEGAHVLQGTADRLGRLRDQVNRLAGHIIQNMWGYRDGRRSDITQATWLLIVSTGGLVMAGSIFALLLWRSQKRLMRQNQELENITEELSLANRTKSEFLASVSHELRTPLNAIIGFSDLIIHETFGQIGDKKYLEYSSDIKHSGTHLLNLINDILDLSKIEAGEFSVEQSHINLRSAITDAVRIVDPAGIRGDHARIAVKIPKELKELYADPRALRQIMINLISNALKYSADDTTITVDAEQNADGGIHIRVSDQGIGIPAADMELVLEPFGQSRQNSGLTHEGTGLGLALSKQLMELSGGRLELESRLGVGTIVHLHFPKPPAAEK